MFGWTCSYSDKMFYHEKTGYIFNSLDLRLLISIVLKYGICALNLPTVVLNHSQSLLKTADSAAWSLVSSTAAIAWQR